MTTRTPSSIVVTLSCAIVLLGGCASTERRDDDHVVAVPPRVPPAPAMQEKAGRIARQAEAKAKRTEKAEGNQNLVKDEVKVRVDANGRLVVEQTGEASWYGKWHHGRKTAAGRRFDHRALTAAHPTLPLGTKAKVTNLETGQSTNVVIDDRGPYLKGRDIDVSKAAAEKIGIGKDGAVPVRIEAAVAP